MNLCRLSHGADFCDWQAPSAADSSPSSWGSPSSGRSSRRRSKSRSPRPGSRSPMTPRCSTSARPSRRLRANTGRCLGREPRLISVWLYTEDGERFKAYNGHCTHSGAATRWRRTRRRSPVHVTEDNSTSRRARCSRGPPPRPSRRVGGGGARLRRLRAVPRFPLGRPRASRGLTWLRRARWIDERIDLAGVRRGYARSRRCLAVSRGGTRSAARRSTCFSFKS